MNKIIGLLYITTLFFSCNSQIDSKLENKTPIIEDTVLYFQDLTSEDLVLSYFDSIEPAKKVTAYFEFGGDSLVVYMKDSSEFIKNNTQFYFDSLNGEPQKALVIFASYFGEFKEGIPKLYDNYGQGPAVTYGIYQFKERKGWYLLKSSNEDFNSNFKSYGQDGQIGEIEFVQSGKQNYALVFNSSFSSNGYTVQGINIYDVGINKLTFHIIETVSNEGVEDGGYRYEMNANFVPSNQEQFDLKISTSGTNYENDDEDAKVIPYNKKEFYRFEPRTGNYEILK